MLLTIIALLKALDCTVTRWTKVSAITGVSIYHISAVIAASASPTTAPPRCHTIA